MDSYERMVARELRIWERKMKRRPTPGDNLSKNVQRRLNKIAPRKFHEIIGAAVMNMIKIVLNGSEYISLLEIDTKKTLQERDKLVEDRLLFYKTASAASGAGTGGGGIFLSFADFPILLSLKMKFMFDAAYIYGFDVKKLNERLFILYLFQLAFSSRHKRPEIFEKVADWDNFSLNLPSRIEDFDWAAFQQEYRDYIDIAKFFQIIPGVGMVVGAVANYKLLDQLGETVINGYRMRILSRDRQKKVE